AGPSPNLVPTGQSFPACPPGKVCPGPFFLKKSRQLAASSGNTHDAPSGTLTKGKYFAGSSTGAAENTAQFLQKAFPLRFSLAERGNRGNAFLVPAQVGPVGGTAAGAHRTEQEGVS